MFVLDVRREELEEPLHRPSLLKKQGRGVAVSGRNVRRDTYLNE
jgi:hypothetical protein